MSFLFLLFLSLLIPISELLQRHSDDLLEVFVEVGAVVVSHSGHQVDGADVGFSLENGLCLTDAHLASPGAELLVVVQHEIVAELLSRHLHLPQYLIDRYVVIQIVFLGNPAVYEGIRRSLSPNIG